jgi:Domain of unknown function (DUF2017)
MNTGCGRPWSRKDDFGVSAPIRKEKDGRYRVRIDETARTVLSDLARQLTPAVATHDPMTKRLFPPAYPDPLLEDVEREYRGLVDTPLVAHHQRALETLVATAQSETLTEEEVHDWLSAVESMRLVLGTRLDVTEDMSPPDPNDPAAAEYALYEYLGGLQYLLVETLAADLPDEGRPEGSFDPLW